jgi:peptide deformylase
VSDTAKKNTDLVAPDDEILKKVSADVQLDDPELPELIENLTRVLKKHRNGAGLAAPQIGVSKRIFIMKEVLGAFEVVINPDITGFGREKTREVEGCLSLPGVQMFITRYRVCDVTYTTPEGDVVTKTLKGKKARVFQHEYDHLQGVLITDRPRTDEDAAIPCTPPKPSQVTM